MKSLYLKTPVRRICFLEIYMGFSFGLHDKQNGLKLRNTLLKNTDQCMIYLYLNNFESLMGDKIRQPNTFENTKN